MKRNATVVKTMVSVDFFMVPTIRFQRLPDGLEKLLRLADSINPFLTVSCPVCAAVRGTDPRCSLSCWRRSTCTGAASRSWGTTQPDVTGKRRLERQLGVGLRCSWRRKRPIGKPSCRKPIRDRGQKRSGNTSIWKRAVAPSDVLMDVIGRNAAPKLLPGTPNLIVTADHLFVEHREITYPEARFLMVGQGLVAQPLRHTVPAPARSVARSRPAADSVRRE